MGALSWPTRTQAVEVSDPGWEKESATFLVFTDHES